MSEPSQPDSDWQPGADDDLINAGVARRRRAVTVLAAVGVLAVVGVLAAVLAINHPHHVRPASSGTASQTGSVMDHVSTVPVSTLTQVGPGHVLGAPEPIKDQPLTANGKPEMLFIGAEFCPYCAAERWPLAVALSRFGTLGNVTFTASSPTDAYPNTATLDFLNATYRSDYLSFAAIENEDRDRKPLRPVPPQADALWGKYSPNGVRAYPFLDFGNDYLETGPNLDPGALAGLTQAQIAERLANPTDPVALSVDGAANILTASICGMTHDQPATVCGSPVIATIRSKIDALPVRPPSTPTG